MPSSHSTAILPSQDITQIRESIINAISLMLIAALFIKSSEHGLTISPDSIGFLGDGSLFAPLYNQLLLQMGDSLQQRAEAAIPLHLFLYLTSTLLIYTLSRTAGQSHIIAYCFAAAFALNTHVFELYLLVHNEAIAYTGLLFLFHLLLRYFQTQNIWYLLPAILIMGFLPPTRYATITVLFGSSLMLLMQTQVPLLKRFLVSAGFGFASGFLSLSLLIVTGRISISGGEVGGRELAMNGNAGWVQYLYGFESIGNVLLPKIISPYLSSSIVLLALLLFIKASLMSCAKAQTAQAQINCNFGLGMLLQSSLYLIFLLFIIQVEAYLTLDTRYMVLLAILLICFASTAVNWSILKKPEHHSYVIAMVLVMAAYFPTNVSRTLAFVIEANEKGTGYAELSWKDSPTLKALQELPFNPKDSILVSNAPEVLQFVLSQNAFFIPERIFRRTGKDFETPYADRKQNVINQLKEHGGYYVHFNRITHRFFYLPSLQEVLDEYPLRAVTVTPDGAIYQYDSVTP